MSRGWLNARLCIIIPFLPHYSNHLLNSRHAERPSPPASTQWQCLWVALTVETSQHGNICMEKDDVPLHSFWTCFPAGKSVCLYTNMNRLWWRHSYSQGACFWTLGPLCQVIRLKYHSNWFTGLLHKAVSVWYSLCPLYQMCTSAQTQACTHACNVLRGNSPKPRLQKNIFLLYSHAGRSLDPDF